MKQRDYIVVILALLIGNITCLIGWNMSINDASKYYNYYKASEHLLDDLEQQYNWVDAVDSEEYYEAVDNIKNS